MFLSTYVLIKYIYEVAVFQVDARMPMLLFWVSESVKRSFSNSLSLITFSRTHCGRRCPEKVTVLLHVLAVYILLSSRVAQVGYIRLAASLHPCYPSVFSLVTVEGLTLAT